ncbi:lipid A biosynthesis acyltransferase [Methylovirgula sp. 4M-Z18]|uniref:lysophospholipid acyltransferase family protein n=1 Tax=Methylovirgula sp. 4M-Z18 TaxID=2293567 RepID=UPI001AED0B11|nr:lipid A biosynthesis acyltransferase [Methylovirgula sp. 4M-Z18]
MTELKYRIEYGTFRLLAWVARALPLELGADISAAGWRLVAPRLKRHKRALAHLAMAFPDMPAAERERIARAMWDNLGRVFVEFFHLDDFVTSDRITFADPNWQENYALPGSSGVVCAPHLGNWEVIVLAANRLGLTPGGIYQRIKNPYVDAYVTKMRTPLYPGGLFAKGGVGARQLLRHTKNGGTAAVLADLRGHREISVPFFGHQAPTTSFPAVVARTLDVPILIGAAVRSGKSRFKFELELVPVARTADKDADIVTTSAAIQAAFERMVRKYPEQWMWSHRRWG